MPLSAHACCICGTVRNCGPYLSRVFDNIRTLGSAFSAHKVIFYYDKSSDSTLAQLRAFQRERRLANVDVCVIVNTQPLLPLRTHRIARGRNACLDKMRELCPDVEYFVMMDCDDKGSRPLKLEVLEKYLTRVTAWDALSFDHPSGYYDCWALSIQPLVMDCYMFRHGCGIWSGMAAKLIRTAPRNSLIPCLSAFNGLGIYRTKKFAGCVYDGTSRTDYIPPYMIRRTIQEVGASEKLAAPREEDCEHRFFHMTAALKNSARIRIAPECLLR